MPDLEAEKALAAERAVVEIQPKMLVGLGSGSTTAYAVRALARQVEKGLQITAASSSSNTEKLARSLGIAITPFNELSRLDITIDGADEIDPTLRAIKGGGGALLREKIIATASDRVIVIVDSSKPVEQLGRFRLPVEVLPFADTYVTTTLAQWGVEAMIRKAADGTSFLTDQNNHILDIAFSSIPDAEKLAEKLEAIPGIIEHGLFLCEIDEVIIGRGDQTEIRKRATT